MADRHIRLAPPRQRLFLALAVLMLLALASGYRWLLAGSQARHLQFSPAAAAVVSAPGPGQIDTPSVELAAGRAPLTISYLRFDVQGVAEHPLARAVLLLPAASHSAHGVSVHLVEAAWGEASLTFENRPALGPQIGASGAHTAGALVAVDLDGRINGDGDWSLALVSASPEPLAYHGAETPSGGPRLVLKLGGDDASALSRQPPGTPFAFDVIARRGAAASAVEAAPTASRTTAAPSATASAAPAATASPGVLSCDANNLTWTVPGRLLRGGRPSPAGIDCLARHGVSVIIDQRVALEDSINEPELARQAGIEYINLGVPDDTAPSPGMLGQWLATVNSHLAAGRVVLVHDAAGRGRMGFWDAVYLMRQGMSPEQAIEGYYLAKSLPFQGAKIGCADGGNGQVQALAEISQALTGQPYYPQVDEYGTGWQACPRPAYMDGWDYAPMFGGN
jgi:hypothetical protein